MRAAFVGALVELAERDPSVMLLTGDLGYTVLEPFSERFPNRFVNVGVAEQNMLGLACGLAASGFRPYAYSIATFASMRPYELFRNGGVLHDLPVRVVGVGGGLDYGHNGVTHYALEDVGIMRVQPGLVVVAPADPAQTREAVLATAGTGHPVYLRLGKDSEAVPGLDGRFALGKLALIGDGGVTGGGVTGGDVTDGGAVDVALVTYGGVTAEVVRAQRLLAERGVAAVVAVCASLAPAPVDDLAALLNRVPLAVTVEAHYRVGGIGSLVSEVAAGGGLGCRVVTCAVGDVPREGAGEREFLYRRFGLTAEQIADTATSSLAGARR